MEEISRQHNVDSVALLLLSLMQVYNEKRASGGKEEYKMCSLGRKRALENLVL